MNLFHQGLEASKNLLPTDGHVTYNCHIFSPEKSAQYSLILQQCIPWQQDELTIFGRRIVTKRETAWYGDRAYAYTYSHTTKYALPWTPELMEIKELAERFSGENYNSCLLNLYHDGSEGMGWHSDDEDTIVHDSAIASVSFGAERRFDLRHKFTKEKVQILLENGSLLVMKGETQRFWQHSLPKMAGIQAARVNLTFRKMKE